MVKLNPFSREENELDKQIDAQKEMQFNNLTAQEDSRDSMPVQDRSPDLVRWQQDMEPYIEQMEHELRSEFLNSDGEFAPIPGTKPLCSEELIKKLSTMLRGSANQNTMMSNFSDDMISKQMIALENSYLLDLAIAEMKTYNTPRYNLSMVKQIFRSYSKPALLRGWGGGERKHMGTVTSIKELHHDGVPDGNKKKSMFKF